MKKIVNSLLTLGMMTTAAFAFDANIAAIKVKTDVSALTPKSKEWQLAQVTTVNVYPQTTLFFNDKNAMAKNAERPGKAVNVAALYNDKEITFRFSWKDATKSVQSGTTKYSDGIAVEFPTKIGNGDTLPYIGMGSEGREVVVHLQKSTTLTHEPNGHGDVAHQVSRKNTNHFNEDLKKFDEKVKSLGSADYEKTFISAGFRSLTEIKDGSSKSSMNMHYSEKHGKWCVTLTRPLKDSYVNLNQGAFPVAIALWDGAADNRGGLKHLSAWNSVKLVGKTGGEKLITTMGEKATGDAKNGEELAKANCAGCHLFPGNRMAMPAMAPELTNIGGYSTVAYLRESILKPSAVVVPGFNRNAHPNFPWYNLENGKRVSAMPDFSWMDEKSVNDVVAYFMTLKAEVK
jgi:complex iron-sulfur molybdoenzyme family reductase subunit gamma